MGDTGDSAGHGRDLTLDMAPLERILGCPGAALETFSTGVQVIGTRSVGRAGLLDRLINPALLDGGNLRVVRGFILWALKGIILFSITLLTLHVPLVR